MSNDVNRDSADDHGGVPSGAPADGLVPKHWVFEDIGQGFALLHPPASLDDVPFPADDPDRMADYDWAQDDPEVQARYGGLIAAVRHRQVWGVGRTYEEADADAAGKPGCPEELVYVYVWPAPAPEGNRSPNA